MQFQAKGKLRDGREFFVRNLDLGDLPKILQLQNKVLANLESQQILQPLYQDEFTYILQGNGDMIGIFLQDRLIAFRAMLIPKPEKEFLGELAGIPGDDRKQIIYSEISNVDPEYRGNGLQHYMGKVLMDRIDREKFRYVLTTVAPFNIPSLKDKFRLGMNIVALAEMYNGKLRYVLKKDLQQSPQESLRVKHILIPMGDIEKQRHYLKEGYSGISMEEQEGEWNVLFVKEN